MKTSIGLLRNDSASVIIKLQDKFENTFVKKNKLKTVTQITSDSLLKPKDQ
jgi:hypothetical protein